MIILSQWVIPFFICTPPPTLLKVFIFHPLRKVNFGPPKKTRSKCQHMSPSEFIKRSKVPTQLPSLSENLVLQQGSVDKKMEWLNGCQHHLRAVKASYLPTNTWQRFLFISHSSNCEPEVFKKYFKNECECFIGFPNTRNI